MSETREAYNVTLQPSRELDALVARVMGWTNIHWTDTEYGLHPFGKEPGSNNGGGVMLPFFSADGKAAMDAWAWLEENKPESWERLVLGRDDNSRPAVVEIAGGSQFEGHFIEPIAAGKTYPHAIALAVVEAGKVIGGNDESA